MNYIVEFLCLSVQDDKGSFARELICPATVGHAQTSILTRWLGACA